MADAERLIAPLPEPFYASGRPDEYRATTAAMLDAAIDKVAEVNRRLGSDRIDSAIDLMLEVLNDLR